MKTISAAFNAAEGDFATPLQDALHKSYLVASSLRQKINQGRGWEGALVGLVRQALETCPLSNEPRWRRLQALNTNTLFEFESFQEWLTNPNGADCRDPLQLIHMLEISPEEEGRKLADRVRGELKLPPGRPVKETGNNVPSFHAEIRDGERGNTAAGVRRRIRNWIQQNPDAPNLQIAQQWLAELEANPNSRKHQQALREIGIGKVRRALDVSEVNPVLLEQLRLSAAEEGMTVAELLEDALAVYFRLQQQEPTDEQVPVAAVTAPADQGGIPAAGFYSPTQLARALGMDRGSISQAYQRKKEGDQILTRKLENRPFQVIFRPGNPVESRLQVIHTTTTENTND